jgi:hypothetical protein
VRSVCAASVDFSVIPASARALTIPSNAEAGSGHYEVVPRSLAWILAALALGLATPAAAQAPDVLVRIPAADPVAAATSLELGQRGLRSTYDDVPHAIDAVGRSQETRVLALALGVRAAVWIDTAPDGRNLIARALRADDGQQGASMVAVDDVRAEPRLAALVLGALVEEILSRPQIVQASPVAPRPDASVASDGLAEVDPDMGETTEARLYGTLSGGAWGRFDPVFGGGLDLRGSAGAEWLSGLRFGGQLRFLTGSDTVVMSDQLVSRLATSLLVGGEVVGRFQIPGHAVLLGASVALGPAQRIGPHGEDTVVVSVIAGGLVGFAFPIGRHGAEMGVQIGLDCVFEPTRGTVAPSPSLALRWDWR